MGLVGGGKNVVRTCARGNDAEVACDVIFEDGEFPCSVAFIYCTRHVANKRVNVVPSSSEDACAKASGNGEEVVGSVAGSAMPRCCSNCNSAGMRQNGVAGCSPVSRVNVYDHELEIGGSPAVDHALV